MFLEEVRGVQEVYRWCTGGSFTQCTVCTPWRSSIPRLLNRLYVVSQLQARVMAVLVKNDSHGHYGNGHSKVKHGNVLYPLKVDYKTKSVVKRSAQKDLQAKRYDLFCDSTLKSDFFKLYKWHMGKNVSSTFSRHARTNIQHEICH